MSKSAPFSLAARIHTSTWPKAASLVGLGLLLSACAGGAQHQGANASAPSPKPEATASYERLTKAAASLLDSGRSERALELVSQAAEREPARPEAYILWGRGLAMQGQLAIAASKYEQARQCKSRDRELFAELSSVYDVLARYDEAIAVYRDWLSDHPTDAEMQQELGLTLTLVERFPEAAEALSQAVAAAPDNIQAREDLGYALLRAQRLEDAATALLAVVQSDPSRANALRMLAQVRAAQGDTQEALALLDRAIAAEPKDTRALRVRARMHQLLGHATEAASDYQQLLGREPEDAGVLLGAAGALIALDRAAEAEPLLAKVRAKDATLAELKVREAQIAWRRGERASLTAIAEAARAQPQNLELWRDLEAGAKHFKDKKLELECRNHLKETGRGK